MNNGGISSWFGGITGGISGHSNSTPISHT
jgi:hypothetical protein